MSVNGPSLANVLGGRIGSHARDGGLLRRPGPWAFLALTVNYALLMVRQIPCQNGATAYLNLCYSDIRVLWFWRGLQDGRIPYLQADVEYPVLIGALMEVGRRLVVLFGGQSAPGLSAAESAHSAALFMGITSVLIFALFAVTVWAHLKLNRPWDALMIAVSPAILTAGLINWDALVVALTSLAFLAWSRKRHAWAGVLLGLGIATKLYPGLLLVPLFVLCLRTGKYRQFLVTAGATAAAWLAVNLPVYLASPSGWLYFWTFNVGRGADLGSIWYALQLAGITIPGLSGVEAVLMVLGTAAILALLLLAPRRPRFAQGAFLIVTLFVVVNKVYSPQYVLWLLPLLVLARPKWREWVWFSVAESLYYVAIWAHLDGVLAGDGTLGRLYWLSVFFRVGVQLWLASRVIIDILRPGGDPIRADGADEPDGGVLDGAEDAEWVRRLQARRHGVTARRLLE